MFCCCCCCWIKNSCYICDFCEICRLPEDLLFLFFTFPFYKSELLLDLLFFLFLRYLLAFGEVVAVIATLKKLLYIHVSFSIFAKFADYTFFFFKSTLLLLCYSCNSCDSYLGVFLLQWNFLLLLRFLQTFFYFCKQFLLTIFLLKLRQKSVRKKICYGLQSLWICYFCYSCYFFYTFSDSSFNFFEKITKTICYQIFATVFNPRHKRRATR